MNLNNTETIKSGLQLANFDKVVDGKNTVLFIGENKQEIKYTITNCNAKIVSLLISDKRVNQVVRSKCVLLKSKNYTLVKNTKPNSLSCKINDYFLTINSDNYFPTNTTAITDRKSGLVRDTLISLSTEHTISKFFNEKFKPFLFTDGYVLHKYKKLPFFYRQVK